MLAPVRDRLGVAAGTDVLDVVLEAQVKLERALGDQEGRIAAGAP